MKFRSFYKEGLEIEVTEEILEIAKILIKKGFASSVDLSSRDRELLVAEIVLGVTKRWEGEE